MPDTRTDFARKLLADDPNLSDADLAAALKVFDAQSVKPAAGRGPDVNAFAAGHAALGRLSSAFDPSTVETIGNNIIGIMKGAGHTAESLGQLAHKIPGVTAAVDALYGTPGLSKNAFAAADAATHPEGTAQKIGYGAEQAGEFLLPAGAAEKGATRVAQAVAPYVTNASRLTQTAARVAPRMATEALSAGGTALAQGSDPTTAATIAAAGPVAGELVSGAAAGLKDTALKQVVQALGPTKERFKAIAEKIAPQMLQRGLRGSRQSLADQAAENLQTAGQAVDDALLLFGSRKTGVQPVVDALEQSKNAFQAMSPTGQTVVFEPRAVAQLSKLQTVLNDLGPDARVDHLVAVRRAWDKVVDQAGGFAQRAPGAIGVPLKDASEAAAKRDATTAIRQLLDAKVPELTAVNKEFSFWKNLDDVLEQTLKRTQPHGPSLRGAVAEAAGAAAGSGGGIGTAFALAKVSKMANAVFNSPRWLMASAQAKDALADAIMSNDVSRITTALSRIGAGTAAQAGGQP